MENWHQHMGVYGVYTLDNELLLVRKTRGPYKNRYDLPGGSFEANESIHDCLIRELNEEIGYSFYPQVMLGTYDYLVPWQQDNNKTHIHHIAMYYKVNTHEKIIKKQIVADDTEGFDFVSIDKLSEENSSPLVIDIVKYLKGRKIEGMMKRYDNWSIK